MHFRRILKQGDTFDLGGPVPLDEPLIVSNPGSAHQEEDDKVLQNKYNTELSDSPLRKESVSCDAHDAQRECQVVQAKSTLTDSPFPIAGSHQYGANNGLISRIHYADDPHYVDKCLHELKHELENTRQKEAYVLAKYFDDDDYVESRAFRLMFLRSDGFDAKLAAKRLVYHFECKRELFGSGQVLGREVRLSDLNEDDTESLESGFLSRLPTLDASGRSIFCLAPMLSKYKKLENLTRAMWYVFTNSLLEDNERQERGVVMLVYNTGPMEDKLEEFSFMKRVHRLRQGIPQRVVGGHYCFDDASSLPFVTGFCAPTRFRFHFGTHNETIQSHLQTYDINIKDLILEDGSLSLEWHREWLQTQYVKASRPSNFKRGAAFVRPRRFDVLVCQAAHVKHHPGNARLHLLIEMYRPQYEKARNRKKILVSNRIVEIIHESYGRFLSNVEDSEGSQGWIEVDSEVAKEKIAHFFRYRRHKAKRESVRKLPTQQPEPLAVVPLIRLRC